MSGLLSKPKTIKPPDPAPAPPVPVVDEKVEDIARKTRPRGRRETFLTGELVPETDKKRKLA